MGIFLKLRYKLPFIRGSLLMHMIYSRESRTLDLILIFMSLDGDAPTHLYIEIANWTNFRKY